MKNWLELLQETGETAEHYTRKPETEEKKRYTPPIMIRYKSISQIKADNRKIGHHFFSRDTLRFFRSAIYPNVRTGRSGWFFVTSEQYDHKYPRLYTVRKATERGNIDTVGKFQGHTTFDSALAAATEAAKAEREG